MTNREHEKWEQEMSTQFNAMMDEVRTKAVPDDSLERSMEAAEAISMTKAAGLRGFKNALVMSAIMYTLVGSITFAISKLLNVSLWLAFMGTCCVAFVALFLTGMVSQVLGRARCGDVLLDCGPFPARKRFFFAFAIAFVASVGLFFVGVGYLLASGGADGFLLTGSAVLSFIFSMYFLYIATGRLLICENGMFLYWGLLRWNKIESYRWEGATDATLMLQVKSRFFPLKRGALPVAIEQKDAVDALLQQHVGK